MQENVPSALAVQAESNPTTSLLNIAEITGKRKKLKRRSFGFKKATKIAQKEIRSKSHVVSVLWRELAASERKVPME